jgi:hypothetical protein
VSLLVIGGDRFVGLLAHPPADRPKGYARRADELRLAGRLATAVGSPAPSVLAASGAVALGALLLALPARPAEPL